MPLVDLSVNSDIDNIIIIDSCLTQLLASDCQVNSSAACQDNSNVFCKVLAFRRLNYRILTTNIWVLQSVKL